VAAGREKRSPRVVCVNLWGDQVVRLDRRAAAHERSRSAELRHLLAVHLDDDRGEAA
jgi:plasmid stability protein